MKKLILFLILIFAVPCQAQLQCIIRVPATEKLKTEIIDSKRVDNTTLSVIVKEKFKQTKSDNTQDSLCNTRIYNNEKIINFTTDMTLKELQDYIKKEGLHWIILGANDGWKTNEDGERVVNTLIYYDAKTVMEFMQRKRVYAKDGSYAEEVPNKIEIWKFGGYPEFEEIETTIIEIEREVTR